MQINLLDNSNVKKAIKLSTSVVVTFAATDVVCQTLEGPVKFYKGDAILTCTVKENWPIPCESFIKNYIPEK